MVAHHNTKQLHFFIFTYVAIILSTNTLWLNSYDEHKSKHEGHIRQHIRNVYCDRPKMVYRIHFHICMAYSCIQIRSNYCTLDRPLVSQHYINQFKNTFDYLLLQDIHFYFYDGTNLYFDFRKNDAVQKSESL